MNRETCQNHRRTFFDFTEWTKRKAVSTLETRKNTNKGITLIALVVTIVVLLILSGITINMLFSDNGIIKKAQEAGNKTNEAKQNDLTGLNELYNQIENITGGSKPGTPVAGTEVTKPSDWTSTNVTPIADGSGGTVPLPSGFYYVGGNKQEGLVISDNSNDKNKGTAYDTNLEGNQFVWIPVANEADLARTEFDSEGKPTNEINKIYIEPCTSGYGTETVEYNTMKAKVLQYGGFYIGRYEAGDGTNGTTLRTGVTTAHTVASKKGVAPYNYVPWGKATNDASEITGKSGAVYLAKKMYETSSSVTSTLCYGGQWDAICHYIGDNNRIAQKKSAPELTGEVETDVSKNIYDLAGNCSEWTMEAYSSSNRFYRSGDFSYTKRISYRYSNTPSTTDISISFRPTLYIK